MADPLEMSPAAYARHRGVTRQAIDGLMKRGKIPFRSAGGKKIIDAVAADFALGETQERVNVHDAASRASGAAGFTNVEPTGLTKAKTATEVYNARMKQLEYEERVAKLLPTEGVARAMEKCAGAIVRDLDQLPNHAEELATAFASGGVSAVRNKLKEIARNVRVHLAESMRVVAAPAESRPS